jgi:hypothetical protein
MSVEQMRSAISSAYKSSSWQSKVSKMSDNQVIAIYYKFLNTNKFAKK